MEERSGQYHISDPATGSTCAVGEACDFETAKNARYERLSLLTLDMAEAAGKCVRDKREEIAPCEINRAIAAVSRAIWAHQIIERLRLGKPLSRRDLMVLALGKHYKKRTVYRARAVYAPSYKEEIPQTHSASALSPDSGSDDVSSKLLDCEKPQSGLHEDQQKPANSPPKAFPSKSGLVVLRLRKCGTQEAFSSKSGSAVLLGSPLFKSPQPSGVLSPHLCKYGQNYGPALSVYNKFELSPLPP